MIKENVGFIGAGNMASAIIEGLLANGISPGQIHTSDPSSEKLEALRDKLKIHTTTDNEALIRAVDVVVLCVKPQVLEQVVEPLKSALSETKPLIISIAAGIEMSSLEQWVGARQAIVRCMPNTPAQVLMGASGLFANAEVSGAQKAVAEQIFSAVGVAEWVADEALIHAVTAVSGSAPAYVFLLIDEMARIGETMGLDRHSAQQLAAQTVQGAAKMVLEGDVAPQQLKRNVMSPGGTTERAISVLEGEGLGALLERAMTACAERSKEMAAQLGSK